MTDYVYLLREQGSRARIEHEQHEFGVHARDVWLNLMTDAGFDPMMEVDPEGRTLFLGRKH